MKRIIVFIWMVACILMACTDRNAFTLSGMFADDDQNGRMIYLHPLDSLFRIIRPIDSAKVENRKFVFKGIPKEPLAVQLVVIDESIMPAAFIAEKGNIVMNFDSELNATVKGTTMNNRYHQFEKSRAAIMEKIESKISQYVDIKISGDLTSKRFQEFRESFKRLEDEMRNVIYNFVKPIIATPAGHYFFMDNLFDLNDKQKIELISSASPDFKNLRGIQELEKRLELRRATAAGELFTDVKGFDLNGKAVSLSDYAGKGNVVLVDFWASRYTPCVRAMPELVKIYQKYKVKGFEIVGISLDVKKDDWKKAVKDSKSTWPQLSNLKEWDDDCAITYGIDAIPHYLLIGKDGIIIERDFNEDELNFILEELLGSK